MTQQFLGHDSFTAPVAKPYPQIPASLLPRVEWTVPRMSALPQSWAGAKRVSLDFETRDEDIEDFGPGTFRNEAYGKPSYIVGVSVAIEDGPAWYMPIRHEGGDNMEEGEAAVLGYVRDRLAEFDGTLVSANAPYEMAWCLHHGWRWSARRWRDPQVAEPLIWELHRSYKLDAILKRWGFAGKDEAVLRTAAAAFRFHPKRELWRLPARYGADYAIADAREPLSLLRKLEAAIEDQGLSKIYELETRVTPICARMRHRGIRVNLDKVDNVERWARRREGEIIAEIERVSGRRVAPAEVWNKDAIGSLFRAVGVAVPMSPESRTPAGRVRPPAPVLDKKFFGGCKHPLGKLVQRWREVNKTYTTFCKRTREYAVRHGDEWRVHCSFHQLRKTNDDAREGGTDKRLGEGTRTGRFSSDNYNIQQELSRSQEVVDAEMFTYLDWTRTKKTKDGAVVPKPWTMAEAWKDVYEPDRGKLISDKDYSQQEPRIEVHYAELLEKAGHIPGDSARRAAQRWRDNPRFDGHQLVVDLIRDLAGIDLSRDIVKQLRLARGYGAGGGKICTEFLFLPTEWKTIDRGPRAGKTYKAAGPEGQRIIDAFDRGAPFIRAFSKFAERMANQRGWVKTLGDRVVHFEWVEWDGKRKAKEGHAASNGICQGGGATMTKQAAVDLEDAGFEIQLQVHDSIVLSVVDRAESLRAAEIMERAIPLGVPVIANAKVGPSLGRAT